MDIKEILFQLEEDIERAAIIKHHAETIFRRFLKDKIENAADAVKIRSQDLIDVLFWLYRVLCSQNSKDTKGESHDSRKS